MLQPTFLILLLAGLYMPMVMYGQPASVQEHYEHQLFVQTGLRDYHTTYRRIRSTRLGPDTADIRATNYPVLFLGYRKHFGNLISVSGSVGYFSRKIAATRSSGKTVDRQHVGGILLTSQIYWLTYKQWRLYSGFGAGLFLEDTSNIARDVVALEYLLNRDFQITPFGFSWGSQRGITGELSLGYYGRYQVGAFWCMAKGK